MVDPDLVLSVATANGKPSIISGERAGAKVIKRAGAILTLTAAESTELGLSIGVADSADDVGRLLGATGPIQVSGRGWGAMGQKAKDDRKEQVYKDVKAEKAAKLKEVKDRLGPQIAALSDKLEIVRADGRIAEGTLNDILNQQDAEFRLVEKQYQDVARTIVLNGGNQSQVEAAKAVRDRNRLAVERRFAEALITQRQRVSTISEAQNLVRAKLAPLLEEMKKAETQWGR